LASEKRLMYTFRGIPNASVGDLQRYVTPRIMTSRQSYGLIN